MSQIHGLQMQAKADKRKAPTEDPSGSSTAKKAKPTQELSKDAQILTRIVEKTRESTLQKFLVFTIANASPSDLNVLKRMLGPLVSAVINPRHCVRCHKSYVEQENTWTSCEIPHLEPEEYDPEPLSDDDYGLDYSSDEDFWGTTRSRKGRKMIFPCCGQRFREMTQSIDVDESCVSSKHTTDPKEVEYYAEPVDSGKGSSKYEGQNTNVVTCQQAGCDLQAHSLV